MHGNRIVVPNPKFSSSVMKLSDYFDEEILKKANKKYYTPTEFKNALKLSTKKKNPLNPLKYIFSVLSILRTL